MTIRIFRGGGFEQTLVGTSENLDTQFGPLGRLLASFPRSVGGFENDVGKSDINSSGTWTNKVQSRKVIFVAKEERGEVCALSKVGSKLEVSRCFVINFGNN